MRYPMQRQANFFFSLFKLTCNNNQYSKTTTKTERKQTLRILNHCFYYCSVLVCHPGAFDEEPWKEGNMRRLRKGPSCSCQRRAWTGTGTGTWTRKGTRTKSRTRTRPSLIDRLSYIAHFLNNQPTGVCDDESSFGCILAAIQSHIVSVPARSEWTSLELNRPSSTSKGQPAFKQRLGCKLNTIQLNYSDEWWSWWRW